VTPRLPRPLSARSEDLGRHFQSLRPTDNLGSDTVMLCAGDMACGAVRSRLRILSRSLGMSSSGGVACYNGSDRLLVREEPV